MYKNWLSNAASKWEVGTASKQAKAALTAGNSLPDAAKAWLKQLPLWPKQPHSRSKFENTEANVWLLQSPWCFWKLFCCIWMGFVISLFAQTLVNPLWLEPCSQHPMACATQFPALGDDMKYGTVSPISIPRQATWIEAICNCKSSSAAVVFDSYWPKLPNEK